MRFLVDEGLPARLGTFLQDLGHNVTTVGHDYPYSLADRTILDIARREARIVLTNDKDFGELIFRDRLPTAGVILFRLGYVPIAERTALMQQILDEYGDQLDQFLVVTRQQIRVRQP